MDISTMTVTMVLVAGALAMVTVVVAVYRRERHLVAYAGGYVSGTAGFVLVLGQGVLDPWLTVVMANLLLIWFHLSLALGLRIQTGRPKAWPHRFTVYSIFWVAFLIWTTQVGDSFFRRTSGVSLLIIIILADMMFTLWKSPRGPANALRTASWVAALGLIGCHLLRLAMLLGPGVPDTTFLTNSDPAVFTVGFTIVFSIFWAGLILAIDAGTLVNQLGRRNEELRALATHDQLTGLLNRQTLDCELHSEMERAARYHQPLTLVMLDLDHFKAINDAWGHEVGDQVLIKAARIVSELVRMPDTVFRWGGEEFIIVAPHTPLEGGVRLAEKVRAALEAEPMPPVGPVTASFGVAQWKVPGSAAQWFQEVDIALYRAKNAGRNRVEVWHEGDTRPFVRLRLAWKTEWESGNQEVDQEHRQLVDLTNALIDLTQSRAEPTRVAAQFDGLLNHISTHFDHEESILRAVGYPEIENHRREHRDLAAEAVTFRDRYRRGEADGTDFFNFLVGKVVMGHMLTSDVKFFPYTAPPNLERTSRSKRAP